MGNTSSHHRVGGNSGVSSSTEKVPRGDTISSGNDQAKGDDTKDTTEAGTKLVNNHQNRVQHRKRSSFIGGSEKEVEVPLVRPDSLTERQKELLKDTWKILEGSIAKVGVITFISLFETHPDVQQVFMPFNGIELEDLKHSKQLRAHALRVMAFVQKAVARLHEPEKLEALLQELGKKHFTYGAKQKYVDLIGPQFIQAIQPSLEDRWTDELQEAWVHLFKYMAYVMKTSMSEEEQRVNAQQ